VANALITSSVITQETLRVIHNELAIVKRMNRVFEPEFGRKGEKAGATINIRKPVQFTVRSGPVASIQDVNETTVPLTIQPEFGIDFAFSDFDLALSIDEFSKRYITPAAKRLATELDRRAVAAMTQATFNSVGTPGTPPASQQATQLLFLQAGQKLTDMGAAMQDRVLAMSTSGMTNAVSYLNAGFNDQAKIGSQYRRGLLGTDTLGFDIYQSPNVQVQTVGPLGGTPLTNGATQGLVNSGATDNPSASTTSLITDGWTAAAAARVVAGDVFTIANVFAVNPETKQSTGVLQQFVVTANVSSDGSGNATLVISPAIIAGGAYQNVTQRAPDNSALTFLGTASTAYPVSLAFVEDAFSLVTVPMDLPKGMDMADQAEADGINLRFVRGFDITNNRRISRFDIMAGYAATRPEWATRVYAG
jgi:hypothetical protein